MTSSCNIRDFGNGNDASVENVTRQINNYATVISVDGAKVTYKDKTTAGLAPIKPGALVMFHLTNRNDVSSSWAGRFFLAKVLDDDGTTLTLNTLPSKIFSNTDYAVTTYATQIISIPQYTNFTLSTENSATMQFDGEKGGVFALACSKNCDLSGGIINVEGKGGGTAYGRAGLAKIGNAQDNNKLPIGEGHGSVFILAKNLTMNSSTRIGATYSGAEHSGYSGEPQGDKQSGEAGNGAKGGRARYKGSLANERTGGYGSNGDSGRVTVVQPRAEDDIIYPNVVGCQGAHIMIIADTITGFNQAAISTGGEEGCHTHYGYDAASGIRYNEGEGNGAGYGGNAGHFAIAHYSHGGYNGGSGGDYNTYESGDTTFQMTAGCGGSSGWAFIWCNNVVNQDTTDTVLFD